MFKAITRFWLSMRARRLSGEVRRRRRALAEYLREEQAIIASLERSARRAHKLATYGAWSKGWRQGEGPSAPLAGSHLA